MDRPAISTHFSFSSEQQVLRAIPWLRRLLFALAPSKAVLSDINQDLINSYEHVQSSI